MDRQRNEQPPTINHIDRTVVEFLALDIKINPEFLQETWTAMLKDKNLVELAHGTLVEASYEYPGHEIADIAGFEGFLKGVAYAIKTVQNAEAAKRTDHTVETLLRAG